MAKDGIEGTQYDYEIQTGVTIRVEATGNYDKTCPKASFTRREFKVVDYNKYPAKFPNDLIYNMPCDAGKYKKVQKN